MRHKDHLTYTTVPGVFLSVFNQGVLLQGQSGIGKSDLALCLLDRGHKLISDDMVEFKLTSAHTPLGSAPALLQNYLHIRDLGVLNIASLFGAQAVMSEQILSLVIQLQKDTPPSSDLSPDQHTFTLLGVTLPLFRLSVHANRPCALLLETQVRHHDLMTQKQTSDSQVFLEKQLQLLDTSL